MVNTATVLISSGITNVGNKNAPTTISFDGLTLETESRCHSMSVLVLSLNKRESNTYLQNKVYLRHSACNSRSHISFAGLNYLVKIDAQGRLRWDRNDELVDTSAGHWKDSGNGQGIIPEDIPQRPARRGSFTSSISSSSVSSEENDEVNHYIGKEKGKNKVTRTLHRYFTVKGIINRLLRKTVKRNTWIFVSDKHC
ncbi:uncharacterized protein EV420DRAFT_927514 [Desarmillaria tabescens]|uniref:Uncharacterized protein n=1 Tax=Armillaria tabescens TaxID=1929756 RepID=A0AA39NFX7_ARMTA|nr:uncharacterized protein EV420DRAFT_927514 [Desarmillaria tabescens]KAK0464911.1 hypothetical protein EV420DRAFT_927514 [Desarmillaria tabescens]